MRAQTNREGLLDGLFGRITKQDPNKNPINLRGKKMRNTARVFIACLVLTFCWLPVFGQDESTEQPVVAWETLTDTLISWNPVQEFRSVTLTVSGENGVIFRREFELGSPVVFDFTDDLGNPLPDGQYTYELSASPLLPQWAYDQLADAREVGDSELVKRELREAGVMPRQAMTQTGWVTLEDGVAVPREIDEPDPEIGGKWKGRTSTGPRAAVVYPDNSSYPAATVVASNDGVIRNSLCVGFDCPNSPTFSDTTILLMENNTRIKFDDTSSIASYPRQDWQLRANSNLNGGPNAFFIDDCGTGSQGGCSGNSPFVVEAGAGNNALYVDDAGRLGLGTSTPAVEIHTKDGDTPTLRLEQDGSSGFASQSWDVAGNETNFFVRDVTNGSKLPLRLRPGAPTSSIDVAADGDVGLGTASPETPLHVKRTDGNAKLLVEEASGTGSARVLLELRNNGSPQFSFNNTATGTDWRFLQSGSNFVISDAGDATQEFSMTPAGNLTISGTLTASAKPFKIDHPLDPANKYLYHNAIESPDMINLYRGNIRLDDSGEAWIELPAWFEALNCDFGYQLTSIGLAAPNLHVVEEIAGNRFKIGGGIPRSKVSWQVTGIRHDAWADTYRIPVEEIKPIGERGSYLHPELFPKPDNDVQRAETPQKDGSAGTAAGSTLQ